MHAEMWLGIQKISTVRRQLFTKLRKRKLDAEDSLRDSSSHASMMLSNKERLTLHSADSKSKTKKLMTRKNHKRS